jgi:threonine dehydrogenase-like Zn-dependent dehydrogenase
MKALVFDRNLRIIEKDIPEPGMGEALIQIRVAGICNTDLEICKGYMDFRGILGHEFVGEVVQCKDSAWIGKRVVGDINIGCGHCEICGANMERHCPSRQVLGILQKDGVFAEFITLPLSNLHLVPENVADEEAVFVEPLAACCEILEQIRITPVSHVAIIGDGKLGQLIAQVIGLTGCRVTVIGKHLHKLKKVEEFGIEINTWKDLPKQLFDTVIEASGSASGFQLALQILSPRGTIILKSTTHEQIQLNLAPIVVNEIQIIGSRCGQFEPAIRLLNKNRIHVAPLITSIFPFNEWEKAFILAQEPKSLKILLQFLDSHSLMFDSI